MSGSIGSRGTTTRGTSVFGGDMLVSGAVAFGNTLYVESTSQLNEEVTVNDILNVKDVVRMKDFSNIQVQFSSGSLPGQHSPSPAKYNVNSIRMFMSGSGNDTAIEVFSIYSGSHSGGDSQATMGVQGIFPESAQSVVVNQLRKDVDFKVFGGGTQTPSFMAIGVDGPKGKLVLLSGSDSNANLRESYDDRSVSLVVSGAVTGLGSGKSGGDFNSSGHAIAGSLFQGDLFVSGAIAGKFFSNDTQFGPAPQGSARNLLGLSGDRVGILDEKARIKENNTGNGLFGSNTRFMVTGSHLPASASSTTSGMRVLPLPYNPSGGPGEKNFSESSISLFHGDVFTSGSLYSFGGEIRLGRPADGRQSLGIDGLGNTPGGPEHPYGSDSIQVGLIQVNSLEVPASDLQAGEVVKLDIVTFNPTASKTVAAEGVRYLITFRDKDNKSRAIYDCLLTGIYDASSGNTDISFSFSKNQVCALANKDVPAYRAFDSLEIDAVPDNAGDVHLTVRNNSPFDDLQSNLVVKIKKEILTV